MKKSNFLKTKIHKTNIITTEYMFDPESVLIKKKEGPRPVWAINSS